jgi:deaminated glutathione amidase
MQPFTAAAIQIAPEPGPLTTSSIKANCAKAAQFTERCYDATGAELIVLPESASTGFTPGLPPAELWQLVSPIPGAITEPLQEAARRLATHVVWGTYERGPEPGVVYNSAVLIGPAGDVLGVYRKTHPFHSENTALGGWVTPGDTVTVVDTPFARLGFMICFDGDYPELARIQAVQGAEVICRPSALLRSADLWELTCRARAYDNHTYVVGANATGADPVGTLYFGNSIIISPIATVLARAATHECWISARLDPEQAMSSLTPGSSVPQVFDHVADRNLDLIRRYAGDLQRPAHSSFPHARLQPGNQPERYPHE